MRVWIKVIFALLAIGAMMWLIVKIGGFALDILEVRSGASGGFDPQFAEPAETVTKPPELTGEGEVKSEFRDNSANWDVSVQTPVDKTADELAAEEEAERD